MNRNRATPGGTLPPMGAAGREPEVRRVPAGEPLRGFVGGRASYSTVKCMGGNAVMIGETADM